MRFNKNIIIRIILCICIFIYHINGIKNQYLPTILADEVGFWTGAAFLWGLDWAAVMSRASYYGFGYGILLAPLLLIGDAVVRYRVALLLNVGLLCGIFLLSEYLIKRWLPNISEKLVMGACFIANLYPYFGFYSHNTQSEILLSFLFIFSLFAITKFVDKSNSIWLIILIITQVFGLSVHMRTIGIVLANSILILMFFLNKKINWKQLILCACTTIFLIILFFIVYREVNNSEYIRLSQDGTMISNISNTITGQSSKLSYLFTIEGIKNFLISFGGKVFYFFAATFLLGVHAIVFMTDEIKNSSRYRLIYIFILLSFLFEIGVAAISTIYPGRIDTALYGRYFENTIYIILVIGLCNLNTLHSNIRYLLAGVIYQMIITLILIDYYKQYFLSSNNWVTITGIIGLVKSDAFYDGINFILQAALVSFLFSAVLLICNFLIKKSVINNVLIFIILSCLWIYSNTGNLNRQYYKNADYYKKVSEWQKIIEDISDDSKINYLFISDITNTDQDWDLFRLRYMLPFKELYVIEIDESINRFEQDGIYLLHKKMSFNYGKMLLHFDVIWEDENIYIMENKKKVK